MCVCVCVPEGGFRGSCWPEGALPFASLQSCTVYLGFQPMQEFRRSVYCLVFGVCMSLAYCSSMCLQMTWCFGVDHICVLLVSMALGSRTQPPQQDPAPIAGPNPPACTCIMQFSCKFTLYCLHIFPELFTAKKIQRKDIDCVQYVLSFSFLYLSCILYCKQDSMKRQRRVKEALFCIRVFLAVQGTGRIQKKESQEMLDCIQ